MADAEEALNSITTDTSAKSRSLYPDGCGVPLLQRVQDEDIIQQLRLARYRCPPGGTAAFTLRLYENQRWSALRREWGAQHLFSTERGALTHGDGIGSYRLVPRAEVRQRPVRLEQVRTGQGPRAPRGLGPPQVQGARS